MENHAGRPEVAAALQGRPGRSVRFSSTVGTGMLYLAFPVETPDGRVVVRTALPTAAVDESLQRIRAIMFRLAVASGRRGAFVVPLLTPRRAPAQGNTSFARHRSGQFDPPIKVPGGGELGELATAFNTMAARLEQSLSELPNKGRICRPS